MIREVQQTGVLRLLGCCPALELEGAILLFLTKAARRGGGLPEALMRLIEHSIAEN